MKLIIKSTVLTIIVSFAGIVSAHGISPECISASIEGGINLNRPNFTINSLDSFADQVNAIGLPGKLSAEAPDNQIPGLSSATTGQVYTCHVSDVGCTVQTKLLPLVNEIASFTYKNKGVKTVKVKFEWLTCPL
jgi:hypothetical protein